ncbi:glutathione S-transferase family protein [Sphingomonas jatrophae]|uniref:glutathione transferase n=1 Tax=Sphingomonas jatrophae TaxID=1166337 RepID=A0A1I6KFW5_9SPHN|nr:glutathione S-transferase family protein [Sphingomonas jatrophae]SFR90097.1 glutathione S-transferase [Sphingomonas jatrophae]
MITVHHLQNSRSIRILWLLEELGLPYEIVHYDRHEQLFAPPDYRRLHGLGKAPVITDGTRVVAESGAIIEYVIEVHGDGRLRPAVGSDDWVRYLQWMHLIEGSVMLPYILGIYIDMLGDGGAPVKPRAESEIALHFGFMEQELTGRDFVVGDALTGADIQATFLLDAAAERGLLGDYPALARYRAYMVARPAYARALKKGGAYRIADLTAAAMS